MDDECIINTIQETGQNLLELFGHNGENWIKGPMAIDYWRYAVDPNDENACKWCLLGGLYKVSPGNKPNPFVSIEVERLIHGYNIGFWNDAKSRTWPEVLNVINSLINYSGE